MKTTISSASLSTNMRRYVLGTVAILMLPLVAMQFTEEVDWQLPDFVITACLLLGAGLMYELVAARLKTRQQRLIAAVMVLGLVLLIWAELAVGIIGTPFAGS